MQYKLNYTVSDLVIKYISTKNYCESGTGEELLAHLYKDVAGDSMNPDVWKALCQYDEDYNDDALNDDEYDFLKTHFSETVEFVMQNHAYTPIMEVGTLPVSVVDFAIKYLGIKDGEKVYLPNAGYGDAVMLLRNNDVSGFINGRFAWALAQIRFYAAGIKADIECLDIFSYQDSSKEKIYPKLPVTGSIDYIITVYNNSVPMPELCRQIDENSYTKCLSAKGKAFLITDGWFLSSCSASDIIKSSVSVIQFPELLTESNGEEHNALCGVCVTSDTTQTSIDLIDLKTASCQGKRRRLFDLDVKKALSMVGADSNYVKHLDKSKMDEDISLPAYYFVNRPTIGHSIDKVMKPIDFKGYDLDESLPIITTSNLSNDFSHSSIDVEELDPISKVRSPWEDNKFRLVTEPCILLSASSTNIKCGYISEIPKTGLAVSSGILTIRPENGVSFETAVLLLQTDYVKQQLSALSFSLLGKKKKQYFNKVRVWPEIYNDDARNALFLEELQASHDAIVDDIFYEDIKQQTYALQCELQKEKRKEKRNKLLRLIQKGIIQQKQMTQDNLVESVNKLQKEKQEERAEYEAKLLDTETSYRNEVRMRKHDMMPHLRQLSSACDNIDYYLSNKDSLSQDDFMNGMKEEVFNQKNAIDSLMTILKIFSREDKFGSPEVVNIDDFFNHHYFDGPNYIIDHDTDYKSLEEYGFDVSEASDPGFDFVDGKIVCYYSGKDYVKGANVFIAKDDLQRLFDNIINNAIKHGFTNPNRGDYNITINLSVVPNPKDSKVGMFQIDVTNNGNPLPKGLDKLRYGLKGEKAGVTAGTGEGGYIVKSIVEHYKGDYDIFSTKSDNREYTTIRILLPIYNTYE